VHAVLHQPLYAVYSVKFQADFNTVMFPTVSGGAELEGPEYDRHHLVEDDNDNESA